MDTNGIFLVCPEFVCLKSWIVYHNVILTGVQPFSMGILIVSQMENVTLHLDLPSQVATRIIRKMHILF